MQICQKGLHKCLHTQITCKHEYSRMTSFQKNVYVIRTGLSILHVVLMEPNSQKSFETALHKLHKGLYSQTINAAHTVTI